MKFTCLQENLKKGINIVEKIIGQGLITLPVLNNILLDAQKGQIKISSTNLEIGINIWISGKIEKPGSVTIPVKLFSNFINNLPNKIINIENQNNIIKIKCENFKANIKGLNSKDFPIIPQIKEDVFEEILSEDLKNGLSQVINCVAISESRPEISGVFINFTKLDIKLVATDSFRLAEKIIKPRGKTKEKQIILPLKTSQEIIRILGETQQKNVKIKLGASQILFDLDEIQLISRLIEGQYPDYKQIIPQSFNTEIIINKQELQNSVKIASLFTGKVNDVKIAASPKKIEVSALESEVGENRSQLNAEIKGEQVESLFNYRYFLDGLNNIQSEKVFLGFNGPANPVLLRAPNNFNYFYIIMPIKM